MNGWSVFLCCSCTGAEQLDFLVTDVVRDKDNFDQDVILIITDRIFISLVRKKNRHLFIFLVMSYFLSFLLLEYGFT